MSKKQKHKDFLENHEHYACVFCKELGANEVIDDFLEDYKEDWRKVIDLNLKRNMNGESHIEYNDIFDKRIKKWEAKKNGK